MPYRIQLRRDDAATWTSTDPTLYEGEIGIETDTGKLKIGDGVTAWTALGYFSGTTSGAAGGDLSGTYPNPTVDGLQGRTVASTAPTDGQALIWNNTLSRWEPSSNLSAERVDFDTTPTTPTDAVGRQYWDANWETISLGLDSNVNLKHGQQLYLRGHNKTGTQIDKGKVVYIDGGHGTTEASIALADADSESTSAQTVGIAAENIAHGSTGFVQVFGYISGLTTNGYSGAEGSSLYLSSTAGDMSSTLPVQPKHGLRIGFLVKKAGSGAGSIFINILNYNELEELSDVLISGKAEQDLLSWDNTAGVWKNRTVSNAIPNDAITFAKMQNIASGTILGRSTAGTGDVEQITCTAAGRALIDDASASAQRTTLSAAPNDATYIVTQASPELSNATDLGSLSTGLIKSTSSLGIATISIATGSDLPSHNHSASDITSGTLATARGGTGVNGSSASNGQLLIGNGTGFSLGTITAGSNITVTNSSGGITIASTASGGGVADGDKGDITVSSSGATWTIDNDAVTYAKIQNVSTTDRLLGRQTAGSGDIEEITCTSAGRALIDDVDAAAQRTTLGLGTAATSNTGDFAAASHVHSASDITTGTLATARGGTGVDGSGATNGQLLIGNGTGFSLAAITAGSNISVTNGSGSITVAGNKTTTTEFTYTSSSTWTKPTGLDYIIVEGCGGGGGGGNGSTTVGGNGGCGGLWFTATIPEVLITTSTLTITIGTGGTAGVAGGDSEIQLASGGAKLAIFQGGRAATPDTKTMAGGIQTNGFSAGGSASAGTGGRHGGMGPGGGGAGQNNTTGAGLAGGAPASTAFTGTVASQTGGAAGGTNGGGAGTAATVTLRGFGEGGGGGGANNAGAGGNGGNGTSGSGGGGGGRGSTTGGTGGSGGNGFIRIIEVKTT